MATIQPHRIVSLDLIRGIAVMGIFSVNVVGMGMIEPAYFSPTLLGFDHVGDKAMWILNFIFIDGKMRSLFSMLFGASLVLICEKSLARGASPARAHYARMVTLLLIGLLHFYLLWWGDILSHYALVGLVAFFFWKRSAKVLLIWAIILLTLNALMMLVQGGYMVNEAAQGGKIAAQLEARLASTETLAQFAAFHTTIPAHAAHMLSQQALRPFFVSLFLLPETLGLMLLGMATYKLDFLTGARRERLYRWWAFFAIGSMAIYGAMVAWLVAVHGYSPLWAQLGRGALTTWTRPIMAIGYTAAIILAFRHVGWLGTRIAAVGRAAFTNYLAPTLIMTPLLFGFGGDLYNQLSRGALWIAFVPAMWALMLLWSKPWLDRYRYGPLEWAWRSMARGRMEPNRKAYAAGDRPAAA